MRLVLIAVLSATSFLTACGPTCQSTCQKLYSEDECYIQRPGYQDDQSGLIDNCMNYCQEALDAPGSQGSYDPTTRQSSSVSINLANESQAAAWMDCISATSCCNIAGCSEDDDGKAVQGGMCAPVW